MSEPDMIPSFDSESQNLFWGELTPDIRDALEMLENRESWTYSISEFPKLFVEISQMLPAIVQIPLNHQTTGLLHQLIEVLANMPFREAISAIAWLDSQSSEDSIIGWGLAIYFESKKVSDEDSEEFSSNLKLSSKVIFDRIKVLTRMNLITEIFINYHKFKETNH